MSHIADRKLAKELLRQNEDSLRLIIDTIPAMAWTVRPDGTVDFINQRWLQYMGRSLEEEVENPVRAIHPDDLPRVMGKWLGDMAAGMSSEDEMRLQQRDGTYRWFLVRTVPLLDERGTVVKWFGTSTDIEDRKQAEGALQRSVNELRALATRLQSVREEERTRLARELHDELGQALTAIVLESYWLIRELPAGAKQKSDRAESITELAQQAIVTVKRISTELRPVFLDDLGLRGALECAAEEFQSRTGTSCELDLPECENVIDQERATALFRILQEILTNVARHATATRVVIRVAEEEGILVLRVQDNGRGISKEQLAASSSLGILGMRERALALGGGIEISGVPDEGTAIEVRIPGANCK